MGNGLDIFIYLIPIVIWVLAQVQQAKKGQKTKSKSFAPETHTTPRSVVAGKREEGMSEKQEEVLQHYQDVLKKQREQLDRESEQLSYRKFVEKKNKTPLGKNPYRESVEHKSKRSKTPEIAKERIVRKEPMLEISDIDWTQAVIYSEILRPRF